MTDQRRFKYSCHSRVKQALKRVQNEIQGTKPENFSALLSRKSSNLSTIRSISGGVRINNIPDKGECSSNNSVNNIESLLQESPNKLIDSYEESKNNEVRKVVHGNNLRRKSCN